MNRFLAAYLLYRKLSQELKIATDRDDRAMLRRERRFAEMKLREIRTVL